MQVLENLKTLKNPLRNKLLKKKRLKGITVAAMHGSLIKNGSFIKKKKQRILKRTKDVNLQRYFTTLE